MFVVVGAWENVAGSISDVEPIPDKISRTMKHAVSITTDLKIVDNFFMVVSTGHIA